MITVASRALGRRADICYWAPPIGTGTPPLPVVLLLHGSCASAWSWPLNGGAHLTAGRLDRGGGDRARRAGDALRRPLGARQRLRPARRRRLRALHRRGGPRRRRAGRRSRHRRRRRSRSRACRWAGSARCAWARSTPIVSAASPRIPRSRRWAAWRRRPATGSTGYRGSGKPDGTALHWLEVNAARLPLLRFDCGTDDHLLPGNRALHAALDARGIEHQYEEFAGGHDWPYWRLTWPTRCASSRTGRRDERPAGPPGRRRHADRQAK